MKNKSENVPIVPVLVVAALFGLLMLKANVYDIRAKFAVGDCAAITYSNDFESRTYIHLVENIGPNDYFTIGHRSDKPKIKWGQVISRREFNSYYEKVDRKLCK